MPTRPEPPQCIAVRMEAGGGSPDIRDMRIESDRGFAMSVASDTAETIPDNARDRLQMASGPD